MQVYDPVADRDQALAALRTLLARGPVPYTPHPGEWDWWVDHADPGDRIEAFVGPEALAEVVINHAEVAAFGLTAEEVIELGRKHLPAVRFTVTHVSLSDHERVEALGAAGFELARPPAHLFERSTAGMKTLAVDGFEIRSLEGEHEHAMRA